MKYILACLVLISSLNVFAQDLSKDQILSVLKEMKEAGIIPLAEVGNVEKKIQDMTPDQFAKMKGVAKGIADKNPTMNQATAPTLENAAASVDTDSSEFKDATSQIDAILKKN